MAVLVLIGLRFLHFGPYIDDPHSWRQCDTANYIWAFYQDGIDLLHPSVCWMGGHKTTILEFPLPEAIVAVLYKLFGPHLVLARLVFLAFFLGAVRYLFLVLREIVAIDLARLSVLVYLMLPLSIFYSRAIHIDFAAVFFAHGMLYHFLIGLKSEQRIHLLLGSVFATLGLVIKAPYAFYLALPLFAWTIYAGKLRFAVRQIPFFLAPILVFIAWQWHVTAVNDAAPEWNFIPDYHKFTDRAGWYFGVWEMRESWGPWLMLNGRMEYLVMGKYGYFVAGIGFLLHFRRFGHNYMRWWAFGTFLYVFIFFNLNLIHDYYQIPLLVPAAFFIATLALPIYRFETKLFHARIPILSLLLLTLFAWNNFRMTEQIGLDQAGQFHFKKYFSESEVPIEAGKMIRANTQDLLTIISYEGLDCRSPHVLYRARRDGWSIPKKDLSPVLVQKLREIGAAYLVLVRNPQPRPELTEYLKQFPLQQFEFGSENWPLRIYDLRQ